MHCNLKHMMQRAEYSKIYMSSEAMRSQIIKTLAIALLTKM